MTGQLSKLDFSGIEGETDPILIDCFIPTKEYTRVKELGSAILLGAKGTGKSSILRKLAEETAPGGKVLDLSPDEFLWKRVRVYADETGKTRFSCMHAWEMHVHLGVITYAISRGIDFPSAQAVRTRFLDKATLTRLVPSLSRVEFREILNQVTLDVLRLGRGRSGEVLPLLERATGEVLVALKRMVILVDRLDLYWDQSHGSVQATEGLILAWRRLSQNFSQLSVLLSLRSDAYRRLTNVEHDKLQSRVVELTWDNSNLRMLLARRVSYGLDGVAKDDASTLWRVFPKFVSGVRGPRGRMESITFLLRLVHERPRDLLNLCGIAKNEAPAGADTIPSEAILAAEARFSIDKRVAMEKEYATEIPRLTDVFQRLRGSRERVLFTTLESKLGPLVRRMQMSGFPQLARTLVECGILGFQIDGEEVYYSNDPSILTRARQRNTTFVIHRSLRSALDVREVREKTKRSDILDLHKRLVDSRLLVCELGSRGGLEPIFKATNKTEFIAATPIIVTSQDGLLRFLNDMYQFIYESSGSGSRLPASPDWTVGVVGEMRTLRDDLDHDLAHGPPTEIRRKKARVGAAYESYIGKRIPEDEQDWMKIQSSVYDRLLVYLGEVAATFAPSPVNNVQLT